MAQTKEGAAKTNAKKLGMEIVTYLAIVKAGNKRCTKCKTWKSVAEFGADSTRGDGLSARCLKCSRVLIRVNTKGRPSAFKGRRHTTAAKAAMSAARKGKVGHLSNRTGIKHTPETRARIAAITKERTPRGQNHYAYTHGKAQRHLCDRRTVEYKTWRLAVFTRDKFTCQKCGDSKGGNLRAHHVKPFATHPELRYSVENGTTLCHTCHELEHYKPDSVRNQRKVKRGHKLF